MVKIVDNRGQYKLTIPRNIIQLKKWNSKTKLRFVEGPDMNIILKVSQEGGVKIVDNAGQFKVTIPKDIILDKRWGAKTILRFIEDINSDVILKEIIVNER